MSQDGNKDGHQHANTHADSGTINKSSDHAISYRKHHAKCEKEGDPHSPHVFGIKTVFWKGAELYRAESKNQETMARYGHGPPDDWMERNVYTRYSALGVSLILCID